jgi:hypothetical protein
MSYKDKRKFHDGLIEIIGRALFFATADTGNNIISDDEWVHKYRGPSYPNNGILQMNIFRHQVDQTVAFMMDHLDTCQQAEETTDVANKAEKPPIGIMPRKTHDSLRARNLLDAMLRYSKANKTIPIEWLEELKQLDGKGDLLFYI